MRTLTLVPVLFALTACNLDDLAQRLEDRAREITDEVEDHRDDLDDDAPRPPDAGPDADARQPGHEEDLPVDDTGSGGWDTAYDTGGWF